MFKYKIYKKPSEIKINKIILDKIFEEISDVIIKTQNWILNIIFEEDDVIKALNREYRKIDNTTDVLSFHYFDNFDDVKKNEIAWEIILSNEKIGLQAKEYFHSKEEECYKLLIHSILHILWFDHENDEDYEIMKTHENKIIEKIEKMYNIKIN